MHTTTTTTTKLLSLGGEKPRFQRVSGLKGHLASCQKELHGTYLKKSMNDGAERAAKKDDDGRKSD
jgi:hypothetical protein